MGKMVLMDQCPERVQQGLAVLSESSSLLPQLQFQKACGLYKGEVVLLFPVEGGAFLPARR